MKRYNAQVFTLTMRIEVSGEVAQAVAAQAEEAAQADAKDAASDAEPASDQGEA